MKSNEVIWNCVEILGIQIREYYLQSLKPKEHPTRPFDVFTFLLLEFPKVPKLQEMVKFCSRNVVRFYQKIRPRRHCTDKFRVLYSKSFDPFLLIPSFIETITTT